MTLELSERVKIIMDVYKLSVAEFAEHTGLSTSTIRRILKEKGSLSTMTLLTMCDAFHLLPSFFLGDYGTTESYRVLVWFNRLSSTNQDEYIKLLDKMVNVDPTEKENALVLLNSFCGQHDFPMINNYFNLNFQMDCL